MVNHYRNERKRLAMKQMKLILLSFLIVTLAFSQKTRVVGTETKKDEPARILKAALNDYKNRNYDKAFNGFVEALSVIDQFQKNPEIFPSDKYLGNNAIPHKTLAAQYAARAADKASKFNDADTYFSKAIEFDKENPTTWYYYGDYLFDSRRKSTEATNAFFNVIKFAEPNLSSSNAKKVRRSKGAMASANYKLGEIYAKKNEKKAIEYYLKALDINPAYWQPRLMLAKIYENLKDYKSMELHFDYLVNHFATKEKSSTKRKQLANAYLHHGIALFNTKKYSEAITALNNVESTTGAKSAQKNAALYYLGMSYVKLKNKAQALAHLGKVSGSFKQSADYEIDILQNPDKYTN